MGSRSEQAECGESGNAQIFAGHALPDQGSGHFRLAIYPGARLAFPKISDSMRSRATGRAFHGCLLLRAGPVERNMLAGLSSPIPLKAVRIDEVVGRLAPSSDLAWSCFRPRRV
jgi:hypothetical protein